MSAAAAIVYRDFWDVPRIFIASHNDKQYLFDCKFDETAEDYPNVYQVYLLRDLAQDELNGSWASMSERAQHHLGEVLVESVIFDASKRRTIDARIFEEIATGRN
jgi:hypothetical protein